MRKLAVIAALALFFSCAKKEEKQVTTTPEAKVTVDSANADDKNVDADEDLHGCKTSEGFTWSVLKNECVRIFEVATRLKPFDDKNAETAAMGAFVIFEENQGNRAELFLVNEPNPIMLERKSEGDSYVNGDWQLIPWKGYVLKKAGEILYTGQ